MSIYYTKQYNQHVNDIAVTLNYTKDLNRVSFRCPMYPTPPNMSTHDKHNEFAIDLFCKMQHNYINKKSWARKLCHVSVNLQNKKSSFVFSIKNVKIYHKLLVYRIVLHFTSLIFCSKVILLHDVFILWIWSIASWFRI